MVERLEKIHRWLWYERATMITGVSYVFGKTVWTRGILFDNKREVYEYEAKLHDEDTPAGINRGRIVCLKLHRVRCGNKGISSEPVAHFNAEEWSLYPGTLSGKKIVGLIIPKLETLPKSSSAQYRRRREFILKATYSF